MKKLVLIGGGNVGRGNTSYKTNPNFLFIGLANSFSDSY